MADSIEGILAGFKESLAADKKKTVVLCVLCLVLMVVLVRQLFFGPTVEPAAASTSTSVVVASPPKAVQPEALIRPRVEVIGAVPQSRAVIAESPSENAARPRRATPTSEKVVSVEGLPRTLSRNIFDTASWSRFTHLVPSGDAEGRGAEEQRSPSFLMQIERKLAAYGRSRRKEERRVDEDLAKLRLESTMTGQVPLAHISGRLVREGELVEGFSVVQIRDRQVMLRKAGVTRILAMP